MEHQLATFDPTSPRNEKFLDALLKADQSIRVHHEPWQRAKLNASYPLSCAYCSKDLKTASSRQAMFSYLVPLTLGAPGIEANRVLACASCAQSRYGTDLLAWPRLGEIPLVNREAILGKRALMLSLAHNHLTPHSRFTKRSIIRKHLENRFMHLRFRVFAYIQDGQAWIGWRVRKGEQRDKQSPAGLLRWKHQALLISERKAVCFTLPAEHFLDAVWDLIEHNGLVVPLTVDGLAPATLEPSDWRNSWNKTFTRVQDLARRKSRRYKDVAPSPPRLLSSKASATSRRNTRAKIRTDADQLKKDLYHVSLWREYESAYADYQSLVRARKKQSPPLLSIEEMRRISHHVMLLKRQAQGADDGGVQRALPE